MDWNTPYEGTFPVIKVNTSWAFDGEQTDTDRPHHPIKFPQTALKGRERNQQLSPTVYMTVV